MESSTLLFISAGLNAFAAGWCLMPAGHYTQYERGFEIVVGGFFAWNAIVHFLGAIG